MMSKKKKDKTDESTKTKAKRSSKKASHGDAIVIRGAPLRQSNRPRRPCPGAPAAAGKESAVVELSDDDIALRAYYIAERRRRLDLPGDEIGDWVEAERQLRAEARKNPLDDRLSRGSRQARAAQRGLTVPPTPGPGENFLLPGGWLLYVPDPRMISVASAERASAVHICGRNFKSC